MVGGFILKCLAISGTL